MNFKLHMAKAYPKRNKFGSNVVPVRLDYWVVKGTNTVDMQTYVVFLYNLDSTYQKMNIISKATPTELNTSVSKRQKYGCYANI